MLLLYPCYVCRFRKRVIGNAERNGFCFSEYFVVFFQTHRKAVPYGYFQFCADEIKLAIARNLHIFRILAGVNVAFFTRYGDVGLFDEIAVSDINLTQILDLVPAVGDRLPCGIRIVFPFVVFVFMADIAVFLS